MSNQLPGSGNSFVWYRKGYIFTKIFCARECACILSKYTVDVMSCARTSVPGENCDSAAAFFSAFFAIF